MGLSRRGFLVATLASIVALVSAGCRRLMTWLALADNSEFDPTSYSFETSGLCELNAESMTGPFYIPDQMLRRKISEDQPGAPLRLRFQVVDVPGCRPLAGAAVEVWHCNALGVYAGYGKFPPDEMPMIDPTANHEPSDAERFCRGAQVTDAQGFVEFETIVPGWYTPRTPHIHVRISTPDARPAAAADSTLLLTNQVYFPDEWIGRLFAERAPYLERGTSPYTNLNDPVIHESEGADGGFLFMSEDADGTLGTLTLGVGV